MGYNITIGNTIPCINHRVYNNGINADIIKDASGKALVIALLSSSGEILATSAAIKNGGTDQAGQAPKKNGSKYEPTNAETVPFYGANNGFVFNNKTLTIPEISYTATKNVSTVKSSTKNADNFALFYIAEGDVEPDCAFEGSNFFQFPVEAAFEDAGLLFVGKINGAPAISDNSNFRLTQTTISFSEQNAS